MSVSFILLKMVTIVSLTSIFGNISDPSIKSSPKVLFIQIIGGFSPVSAM